MGNRHRVTVFDFGGSIVAPDKPDTEFLARFIPFFKRWLEGDSSRRAIVVVGGGGPARAWQGALRKLAPESPPEALDWVGVMATRLNAELVRALLGSLCPDAVVTDPTASISFNGRVLMAAGWKPGFSTDYDSVILAQRFGAKRILMLSNIAQIYDDDPQVNPDARPMDRLSWDEYQGMAGEVWIPGANLPFDPVASRQAAAAGLTLIAASGRNLENLERILNGEDFVGTIIAP